jgi:SAM-dependent methyltransferase
VTTPEQLAALHTPAGEEALRAAARLVAGDPLAAVSALRARGVPPDLAATALTQARLRARATAKFGADAARMFFTESGLEQATRAVVARRRAQRLAGAGVRELVDVCCGIGADTVAAARAGIRVRAVDADPAAVAVAAANVSALGLADLVTVELGRAEDIDLSAVSAAFCDPSRRRHRSGRRVFDPNAFSPPWSFVSRLVRTVPRTVLKLAPGVDHALIPDGAEAEWVSVDGDLVEAAFWCGPLAAVPRRASVLRTDGPDRLARVAELTGDGRRQAPSGPVRTYLLDPDPAVVRAHLVAELADRVGGNLADPAIAYLYADDPPPTPFARVLRVDEALPFSVRRLRAALRARDVGRVEIMKRGSAVDPERLRRDLRLTGDADATVVLTRVAGSPTALVCHRV